MTTPLPAEIVDSRCKPGTNSTCSFLGMHPRASWFCMKGTELEDGIRRRREERSMKAMGDNCSGPPQFAPYHTGSLEVKP